MTYKSRGYWLLFILSYFLAFGATDAQFTKGLVRTFSGSSSQSQSRSSTGSSPRSQSSSGTRQPNSDLLVGTKKSGSDTSLATSISGISTRSLQIKEFDKYSEIVQGQIHAEEKEEEKKRSRKKLEVTASQEGTLHEYRPDEPVDSDMVNDQPDFENQPNTDHPDLDQPDYDLPDDDHTNYDHLDDNHLDENQADYDEPTDNDQDDTQPNDDQSNYDQQNEVEQNYDQPSLKKRGFGQAQYCPPPGATSIRSTDSESKKRKFSDKEKPTSRTSHPHKRPKTESFRQSPPIQIRGSDIDDISSPFEPIPQYECWYEKPLTQKDSPVMMEAVVFGGMKKLKEILPYLKTHTNEFPWIIHQRRFIKMLDGRKQMKCQKALICRARHKIENLKLTGGKRVDLDLDLFIWTGARY